MIIWHFRFASYLRKCCWRSFKELRSVHWIEVHSYSWTEISSHLLQIEVFLRSEGIHSSSQHNVISNWDWSTQSFFLSKLNHGQLIWLDKVLKQYNNAIASSSSISLSLKSFGDSCSSLTNDSCLTTVLISCRSTASTKTLDIFIPCWRSIANNDMCLSIHLEIYSSGALACCENNIFLI